MAYGSILGQTPQISTKVTEGDNKLITSNAVYEAICPLTPVDTIASGNTSPVTSNAVFNALSNLPDSVQIYTGAYFGKGTAGSSNKNSLIFTFDPKVVIIRKNDDGYASNGYASGAIFIQGQTKGLADNIEQPVSSTQVLTIAWSTNKVTWHASGSASSNAINQLNQSGVTYRYIAIG